MVLLGHIVAMATTLRSYSGIWSKKSDVREPSVVQRRYGEEYRTCRTCGINAGFRNRDRSDCECVQGINGSGLAWRALLWWYSETAGNENSHSFRFSSEAAPTQARHLVGYDRQPPTCVEHVTQCGQGQGGLEEPVWVLRHDTNVHTSTVTVGIGDRRGFGS